MAPWARAMNNGKGEEPPAQVVDVMCFIFDAISSFDYSHMPWWTSGPSSPGLYLG